MLCLGMGRFDRFADRASGLVSHAGFFVFCVLMVVIWVPSYFLIQNADTWQLIINTCTTIVTFLMVAILENSQRQFENSTNVKLDRLLAGLARVDASNEELLEAIGVEDEIGAHKPD